MNRALADVILVLHFLFALAVVAVLPLIWLGALRGWNWIRIHWVRLAHLAAICIVAAEALAGVACPLTVWEHALRGTFDDRGFVAAWIARLLYYDLPGWVFTVAYTTFALLVWLTWRLLPPRPRGKPPRPGGENVR